MNTILFSHARTALKFGLLSSIEKKNSYILVPDYICEVVPNTILLNNYKLIYYRINDDFTPDWQDLNEKINKNISAVMMVHYFGIRQNVNKFFDFAKKNKILLIEDNAHSLINWNDKNTYFDFSISSPRKNLNLFSGGSLTIDNLKYDINKLIKYPLNKKQIISTFHKKKFDKFKIFIKKNFYKRPKYEINFDEEEMITDYLIDDYSYKVLNNSNLKKIKNLKIKKFNYWNEFALKNNLKPIFSNLSDDETCPWCCPVYSNSKEETVYWYKWGWKKGIFVFSWPNLIPSLLKDNKINKRRERLICFSTN